MSPLNLRQSGPEDQATVTVRQRTTWAYLPQCSSARLMTMKENGADPSERCIGGRCWVGPILIIETKGGSVPDCRQWIKIMLSHHHDKEMTLGLMACLELSHVHEEHAIMAYATGREPMASVLREIYARVRLDHGGVLRSNCSTYIFSIAGEGEVERCEALISHYDWIARSVARRRALGGASD